MCAKLCAAIIKGTTSSYFHVSAVLVGFCFVELIETSVHYFTITNTTELFTISTQSRQRNTNIAISNHNSEHRYLNDVSYQKTVNFVYKINIGLYIL